MKGRIVQVREYTDKPNKFLVVELTDENDLQYILAYENGEVSIDRNWES